jgi:hypothetical protein
MWILETEVVTTVIWQVMCTPHRDHGLSKPSLSKLSYHTTITSAVYEFMMISLGAT